MAKTYRILSPVEWDGVRYEIDETVEMPKGIARQLVEVGAIAPHDTNTREGEDGRVDRRREPSTGAGTADGEPATRGDAPPPAPAAGGGEPSTQYTTAAKTSEGGGALASPPAAAEDRHAAIVAATAKLDPKDARLWSGRGKSRKPRVDAIEAVLGYDITAAERDAAWATVEIGG